MSEGSAPFRQRYEENQGMYDRRILSDAQINRELLDNVFNTNIRWVVIAALAGLAVATALSAAGFLVNQGLDCFCEKTCAHEQGDGQGHLRGHE